MSENQIVVPNVENVPIDTIQIDQSNPNHLSDQQMAGLRESMKANGYLMFVVIDQNNVIVDGEHRFLIYKQLGQTHIPALRVNVRDENHRRLIRQSMNKLHGTHDLAMDLAELKHILDTGTESDAELLKSMLAITDNTLKDMEKALAAGTSKIVGIDPDPKGGYVDSYLHGNIKQITLYFKNEDYEAVMPRLQKVMEAEQLEDHTALFMKAFEKYWTDCGFTTEEPPDENNTG